MTLVGFSYVDTPASGQDALLRAEFVASLSAAWDVGTLVSWNPSGVAARATSAFVLYHLSTGYQVLVVVGDGTSSNASYGVNFSVYQSAISSGDQQAIVVAADFTGNRTVGVGSFWDQLYNDGTTPDAAGFWSSNKVSDAFRAAYWKSGGECQLNVIENDDAAIFDLLFYTKNTTNAVGLTFFSATGIDQSVEIYGVGETAPPQWVAFEAGVASTGTPAALTSIRMNTWRVIDGTHTKQLRDDLYDEADGWGLDGFGAAELTEIGGERQTQPVVVCYGDTGGLIMGRVRTDLLRFYPKFADTFGKRWGNDTDGHFFQFCDRMVGGWSAGLSDIL